MPMFSGRMVSGLGKRVGGKRAQAAGAAAARAALKNSKYTSYPAAATAANKARASAMQASYISSGRKAMGVAAGAGALGSVGMYKNRDGSRGGYRAPSMRAPRGTGRYA
jgi:hypothetical protein